MINYQRLNMANVHFEGRYTSFTLLFPM